MRRQAPGYELEAKLLIMFPSYRSHKRASPAALPAGRGRESGGHREACGRPWPHAPGVRMRNGRLPGRSHRHCPAGVARGYAFARFSAAKSQLSSLSISAFT
jgi:hypothetical protein